MFYQDNLKQEQRIWAQKYREQGPFVVFHSETNGLYPGENETIEAAFIDGRSGEVLFNSLMQPEDIRHDLGTHIHGITREMIRKAPFFPDVWPAIEVILRTYPRVLVYNTEFHFGMLAGTAKRYGYQLDGFQNWTCLMQQYARYHAVWSDYHGNFSWCSLNQACKAMHNARISSDGPVYRACTDAIRALGVFNAMADQELTPIIPPLPVSPPDEILELDDFPF